MTAYSIVLPNGKVHNFNAATWAEAVVIAKNWGVPESGIKTGTGATTPTTTTPATTTPTTTTPPATTTTTTTPTTPQAPTGDYSKEEQIAIRLVFSPPDRELTRYEKDVLSSVANRLGLTVDRYKSYLMAQSSKYAPLAEYWRYEAFLKTPEGKGLPVPKDFEDYQASKDRWQEDIGRGYTDEQLREYNEWKRYASQFGELGDWRPISIADWLANYDQAQQLLTGWRQQGTEYEKYDIDPEEAARRREEAYAESRYAAEERYHEAPRYQETFSKWIQGQGDVSGALQQYIQSKYPSLRAEFESGISREVGFPTREEARTEASQREAGWQSWLSQRMPETRQDYWGQRPSDRGERYYMYAPTTKTVNW